MRFQCVKFFRPEIGSCKFFDKFQVWLYVFRPCASVQYLEINVSKWRINSPRIMKSLMKRQMLLLIFSLKRGFSLIGKCKFKVVLISIAEG